LWRRRSIRWPDGAEDTQSIVYWLQTPQYFVDIRIPPHRPSFNGIITLDRCRQVQRQWLGTQQGFAGILSQTSEGWQWIREIDFQPRTGARDIGRLTFTDPDASFMIEEGVDEPYVEIWERINCGGEPPIARKFTTDNGQGFYVAVGNRFIVAIDNRASFQTQLSSAEQTPPWRDLNMEISCGTLCDDVAAIEHSTFPWREGQTLPNHFQV